MARLKAVEDLLARLQGTPQHEEASNNQSRVLVAALEEVAVKPSDLGEIAEHIARCSWSAPEHKAAVSAALGGAVVRKVRAKQQNTIGNNTPSWAPATG